MIAQAIGLAGLTLLTSPATVRTAAPGAGLVATEARQPSDDPVEWRDQRRAELRRAWDLLEGKPAPSLGPLSDWINVESLDWKDLHGKVVVIDYWATWCGPCRKGIPHLKEMYKELASDGLVILGVHSARGWDKMAALARGEKIDYPLAVDKDSALGSTLGVQYLPTYFVVDRNGTMRVAGAERSQLDAIVASLLSEEGSASDSTPSPAATGEPSWPETIEKRLYATDLRGKQAPAFEPAEWLGSEPQLAGKVVLYDLWATWCGPCRQGIPKLNEYQKKFGDDLVVVGVSDEDAGAIRGFMKKNTIAYPMAVDGGKLKRAVGAKAIPHVIVVSSDGVVRWQGVPHMAPDALSEGTLKRIIEMNRTLGTEPVDAR
ncbi:MAG: cytochrome c biogenesis protein CcmG/thiol:disulfide interchange protein DsbE [Chlamydiales bacterium]|jgi:cytochrome c biogenesis protein CcmG/thiol:disulfide interchange protein DsbE